jgi:hypothetical protein
MNITGTGVITATGTKGLLQYLKTYQPDLYAAANPQLIAYAKQQNGEATAARAANGSHLGRIGRMGKGLRGILAAPPMSSQPMSGMFDGLGDYYGFSDDGGNSGAPTIDLTPDISPINVSPIDVSTPPDLTIAPTSGATDSASVASSGATSSGFANIISSIAKGIGTVALTSAQVNANNTLLATNLARAQQGLPPLTATTGATGLTTLGSSSTVLLLGGAALIAALVLGNKK